MKNAIIIFLLMMTQSCTKSANKYLVSLSSIPSATGITQGSGEYEDGSVVTVTAEANSGYTFTNWSDVSNGNVLTTEKSYTFSISGNRTLLARFAGTSADTLISVQENSGMKVIPDYGNNIPQDKLQVLTRYIGNIFPTEGISVTQSGAVTQSGETDMVINTKDLENRGLYKPIVGGGPHIWISKSFSSLIYPWVTPNQNLVFQMYATVPVVNLTDPQGNTAHFGFTADQAPVTQLSFGFYLLDEITGKSFAYIICAYESRGAYTETAASNDTFVNFASTPVRDNSQYITKSPLSAVLQSSPYSVKKLFKVHISTANLLKAIRDANHGLSEDLGRYHITSAGILFELPNYVKDGYNATMVNISKFSVYIGQD